MAQVEKYKKIPKQVASALIWHKSLLYLRQITK